MKTNHSPTIFHYLFGLVTISIVGLGLIISTHLFFQSMKNNLHAEIVNEQAYMDIGEQIHTNVYRLEGNFYKLATANQPVSQQYILEEIEIIFNTISNALMVLEHGGRFEVACTLNTIEAAKSHRVLTYSLKGTTDRNTFELNSLKPMLLGIQTRVNKLEKLLVERYKVKKLGDPVVFKEVVTRLKFFLKSTDSYFARMREKSHLFYHIGIDRVTEMQDRIDKRQTAYRRLEISLISSIIIAIIICSLLISKQIAIINRQLRHSKNKAEAASQIAQEASKAKSEFLANMSHEIRTPMNAIVGFTDMALATKLTEEQNEYILAVNHGCDTLLGLINDILDFSKMEAGKLEIDHLEFNLQELISKLTTINQGRIKEKNLEFSQDVPSLDRLLIGDPARVQQILTNLIGNAVKFTSQGQISIIVKVKEQTAEKIILAFAVSDTGIGIATERQNSIFEAFTQADGSVTRDFGGTGLGLTISNQLVALLGGTTLQVSSQEGSGSSFSFELPFPLAGKISKTNHAENKEEQTAKIPACRILLVEDNPVNVKLATRLLEKQGHTITVAENGRLGVDAAFSAGFDLILMDMQMPVMDGLTATREIRRKEKELAGKRHLPIIAMTANAMTGDRDKCIEAGMDDYLSKPIKIEMINQMLSQYLPDSPLKAPPPGRTALVVDDNPVNCKLLSAGLKRKNYKVLVANDGKQAVDTYQQEKLDIILMDIQMPVMDGLTATKTIRELEANGNLARIPIIAVTAHASQEEWLEAGMDAGYKKPVKLADMLLDIEKILKRQEAGRE